MAIILTLAVIFVILCTNEIWWHFKKKQNELSRKFVHISVGTFAAFWPFYLSYTTIKLLAVLGVAFLIFSKYFKVLKSIHNVKRATWGEVCSALIVGILAFLTHNKWLYAASLLQIALADGLAALIGVKYGKKNKYKVLGHTKSLSGSITFFITSFAILIVLQLAGHLGNGIAYLGLTSLVATGIEAIGIQGLDNLAIPLVVLLMIR